MIEEIGLLVLRCLGYGSIWGRAHYRLHTAHDIFGDGGFLFEVGFVVIVVVALMIALGLSQ